MIGPLPGALPGARRGAFVATGEPYPGHHRYVDSVKGRDHYHGRSSGRPYRTIAKIRRVLRYRGARYGLARGSFWREELILPTGVATTVTGYGRTSLPLPRLDCCDRIPRSQWVKTAGLTNVYEVDWVHGIGNGYLVLWRNGTPLTWVSTSSTCDSTPGSFSVTNNVASSPTKVYVHPPGSISPSADKEDYEMQRRTFGIAGVEMLTKVSGIWMSRPGHADGSGVSGMYYDCLFTEGGKHNALGQYFSRCVGYKTVVPVTRTTSTIFVIFQSTVTGAPTRTYDRCYAYGSGHLGTVAFYAHTSGGGGNNFGEIRVRNCAAYNTAVVVGAADLLTLTIEGLLAERHDNAIQSGGTTLLSIINSTFLQRSIDGNSPNGTGSTRIVDNPLCPLFMRDVRVYGADRETSGGMLYELKPGSDVRECTFVGGGAGYKTLAYATGALNDPIIENCIVYGLNQFWSLNNATGIPSLSDKSVLNSQGDSIDNTINNVVYFNWADYRAAHPTLDVNSSTADPLLGNPQRNDFALGAGTPADTGGRAAGSRKSIPRPDWVRLTRAWDRGRLGIDGTGLI